jgi:hypothetical protein
MSQYAEAYALVKSLSESGDLSHDQANPLLEALQAAYGLESDYGNLCYFYRQAQELRYLIRDILQVRPGRHTEAVQRADRQWQVVRDILAHLALDEEHPGRAGGARPNIEAVILKRTL